MSTGLTETGIVHKEASASDVPGVSNGLANGALDGASSAAVLTCTSCGAANVPDSRFCRSCGASLRAGDAASPQLLAASGATQAAASEGTVFDRAVAAPAADTASAVEPTAVANAPVNAIPVNGVVGGGSVLAASTSASMLPADARRARQLLDKAFALGERGDLSGAILACRQSVALAPDAPQGFSMLGLLLERSGDLEQAAAAYARVLRLAPNSRLEMESLERIRATLNSRRGEAPLFRFDEHELEEAWASALPPSPALAATAAGLGAAEAASAAAIPVSGTALNTAAPVPDTYPNSALPLIVSVGATSQAAPSISALQFDVTDVEAEPWWKRVLARPSAFSRAAPVAGAAGLSLLFLIWARGAALSRYPQDAELPSGLNSAPLITGVTPPLPGASSSSTGSTSSLAPGGVAGSPSPGSPSQGVPPGVAGPNDGYPVSNQPRAPGAPANQGAVRPGTQANGGASSANQNASRYSGPGRAASRPQPVFPPAGRVAQPEIPNNLPPMRVLSAPAAPSVSVAPGQSQNNLTSSGGGPLGPATSSGGDTITLTRPRSPQAASPRTSAARERAEQDAARAARYGHTDEAISNLNRTVSSGGETGWTYQQRALAFITRGDYQRAADDFQTAISAYRDQKARGEHVDEAQAGIAACQSGLALALQNLHR